MFDRTKFTLKNKAEFAAARIISFFDATTAARTAQPIQLLCRRHCRAPRATGPPTGRASGPRH